MVYKCKSAEYKKWASVISLLNEDETDQAIEEPDEIMHINRDSEKLLKEIKSLRKQVELLSNRPPQPPPPQIDPSIAAVCSTLIEAQKQLLDRQTNQNVIQITSTNDTANSIQIFKGDIIDDAFKWMKKVERISTLAH
ncbi:uncharacterized protein TNCV_3656431 [Trichonephila clavipes]|nr:uncharacterized protein TNCV_3656431 [Trichonephila clavipes]